MDITIAHPDDWQVSTAQLAEHGGMALHIGGAPMPEPLAMVEVVFRNNAGTEFARAVGQVVHIDASAHTVALLFHGPARDALMSARYSGERDEPGPSAAGFFDDLELGHADPAEPDEASPDGPDPIAGSDERPLWVRYPELSKTEKIRVARLGNRDARRLVLGDRDQTLHVHLLNNPGLSADEVAGLIRAGGASLPFIQRLAQRADIMGNGRVVEALVMNPSTPIKLAVDLVPRLPMPLLRRIAKTANLRMPIVRAARKRVIG